LRARVIKTDTGTAQNFIDLNPGLFLQFNGLAVLNERREIFRRAVQAAD
jgi:hypothetical protein